MEIATHPVQSESTGQGQLKKESAMRFVRAALRPVGRFLRFLDRVEQTWYAAEKYAFERTMAK